MYPPVEDSSVNPVGQPVIVPSTKTTRPLGRLPLDAPIRESFPAASVPGPVPVGIAFLWSIQVHPEHGSGSVSPATLGKSEVMMMVQVTSVEHEACAAVILSESVVPENDPTRTVLDVCENKGPATSRSARVRNLNLNIAPQLTVYTI